MYLIHFLRREGVSKENALRTCKAWNKRNEPPLEDSSVRYKVDYHYQLEEPYHYFYSLDPRRWNISENLTLINKGEREEAEPSRFIEKGKVIPKRVADAILGEFTIRTRGGDHQIFFYDDSIYNPNGRDLIRKEAEKLLGRYPMLTSKTRLSDIFGIQHSQILPISIPNKTLSISKMGSSILIRWSSRSSTPIS
jgi:hypothetical protein